MDIQELINRYEPKEENILSVLQDIQAQYNYLPEELLQQVAKHFGVPVSRVYSLATFYKAFSLKPKGKYICQVCLGTACHVRGGPRLVDAISNSLNIQPGETTSDGVFTLETVNCVGACALGPLVVINGQYYGKMTPTKVNKLIQDLSKKENIKKV
ncbi:MAG: NADH-quinone oxidoreductase subunit NuoE [Endomicrobia bacterium]|nr:NADH-quinone oxidoreductase subunit NuoE [Endomicrobiia bacterium]